MSLNPIVVKISAEMKKEYPNLSLELKSGSCESANSKYIDEVIANKNYKQGTPSICDIEGASESVQDNGKIILNIENLNKDNSNFGKFSNSIMKGLKENGIEGGISKVKSSRDLATSRRSLPMTSFAQKIYPDAKTVVFKKDDTTSINSSKTPTNGIRS
jgi:hypothetical protein